MQATISANLDNFAQRLRDYQLDVVEDASAFVAEGLTSEYVTVENSRRLYTSPTGTGKGTMILATLKQLVAEGYDAWVLTPSLEVIRGFLERTGWGTDEIAGMTEAKLAKTAESIRVTTPVRLHNRVLAGEASMPDVILYDEAHHAVDTNSISGTLFAIAPQAIWLGFTATAWRGTPEGTRQLHEDWGEPVLVMSVPEAVEEGWMAKPVFRIVPLLDDDKVKVVNGRFQTEAVNRAMKAGDTTKALAKLVAQEFNPREPMAVVVPSTLIAGYLCDVLGDLGLSADVVVASTPAAHRADAYASCRRGDSVLICVKVLSEGVDLPWLHTMIDARPCTSSVEWLQRIGRIMRPRPDKVPLYICTNRNLERFAYLMAGVIPKAVVREAQEAFGGPTKRDAARSLGYEALGRFKRLPIPIAGGIEGSLYLVHSIDAEGVKTEWAVLQSPLSAEALVARRETTITVTEDEETGQRRYDYASGKWVRDQLPTDLTGWATSTNKGALSSKQRDWWEKRARIYGLDADCVDKLTKRQFAPLPILSDLRVSILEL